MEWRKIMGNIHHNTNKAGTFNFARGATGLIGANSGSPIASFLLGAVDDANSRHSVRRQPVYPRQNAWIFHAGDTWRVNDKLTLDYGLRWDYYSPSSEKYDVLSFFDPIGANPGAGGRLGRLAFAGDFVRSRQLRRAVSGRGLVRRIRAASRRCIRAQRQDRGPRRVGHLLHSGVLSRLERRDVTGRVLEHSDFLLVAGRDRAGVLPR